MPNDTRLQLEVIAELKWEPSVAAANIGVAAKVGIVTLSGTVESYAQKHAAEIAARRVKGVLAVAQEIDVQVPFERQRGDEQIAAAALERVFLGCFHSPRRRQRHGRERLGQPGRRSGP